MVKAVTVALETVKVVLPGIVSIVAVIVVFPVTTGIAKPPGPIVATVGVLLVHVTRLVILDVELSE